MDAAPSGLLMAAGVSPNAAFAAPDGLHMAATPDGLTVSNSFLELKNKMGYH
jgi:hypothetical protein